jgi:hypothetical protein
MERKTKIMFNGQMHDATFIPVTSSQEQWNEYILDDGSLVRLKTVVTEIYRIDDVYSAEGDPLYHIKSKNIASAITPEALKKRQGG